MRVSRYACFVLRNSAVSAAEMTARLGLEPDEVSVARDAGHVDVALQVEQPGPVRNARRSGGW
jgi:hypothetical protein